MTAPNPLTYEAALEAMARAMAAYLYNGDEEDGCDHAETVALVLAAAESAGWVLRPKEEGRDDSAD